MSNHMEELDEGLGEESLHPTRKLAIEIIEEVIEPFIGKEINGEKYFRLEDNLVEVIERNK